MQHDLDTHLKIDLDQIPLNKLRRTPSCGSIARLMIKTGSHPDQVVRFVRGNTKVFTRDYTLGYWAKTRVKESTDGEWMKTVPYDDSFQLRSPRQMDSEIGVKPEDNPTYQTAH